MKTESIDLSQYAVDDLQKLQDRIAAEIKRRRVEQRKDLLAKLKQMAAAGGYSLEELIAVADAPKVSGRKGKSVPPKYRNPADASQTWTGRGRQPKWVVECLAKGMGLEQLAI